MFNQEDFFKVLDFLQNEERSTSDLPSEIQQLAKSVQGRTRNYFAAAVDIPAFNTDDYNRLRRMIIDWYSSLKTFQDISKGSSDAFSLPVELLDLSCRGFGFPYVKGIEGKIDCASDQRDDQREKQPQRIGADGELYVGDERRQQLHRWVRAACGQAGNAGDDSAESTQRGAPERAVVGEPFGAQAQQARHGTSDVPQEGQQQKVGRQVVHGEKSVQITKSGTATLLSWKQCP